MVNDTNSCHLEMRSAFGGPRVTAPVLLGLNIALIRDPLELMGLTIVLCIVMVLPYVTILDMFDSNTRTFLFNRPVGQASGVRRLPRPGVHRSDRVAEEAALPNVRARMRAIELEGLGQWGQTAGAVVAWGCGFWDWWWGVPFWSQVCSEGLGPRVGHVGLRWQVFQETLGDASKMFEKVLIRATRDWLCRALQIEINSGYSTQPNSTGFEEKCLARKVSSQILDA